MRTQKTSPAVRFLPSLTDVAFLMPILFLFFRLNGARTLLGDGDTGWHIRTGEWILDHGRVPDRDIFSFTKPGEPWVAWEWLWDVTFAWLHRQGGMAAVVLASILMISLTCALLYRLALWKCDNAVVAITVTFLAAAGSSIHWLARPHLVTLLLTVVFYSALERAGGQWRRLIWLPALMVPWANLHGGFLAGLILIGAYAAGEILCWLVDPDAAVRRAALARAKGYALVAGACLAASFLNPYSWKLHAHILGYLRGSFESEHILEFLSFNFQHPAARYFEPMILLGITAAVWNLYRRRFAYPILLAGWAHLALSSARNVPLYLMVAAPAVAATIVELGALLPTASVAGWIRRAACRVGEATAELTAIDRIGRVPVTSALALLALAAAFRAPAVSAKFRADYDPASYPVRAVEALRGPEFRTGVFTQDDWGDYLIYRLYPQSKVFVDGRSDFYGARFEESYVDVLNGKHTWKQTLERYGVRTVLMPVDHPMSATLKESTQWRAVYDDGTAIIFRSTASGPGPARPAEGQQAPAVTDGGIPAIAGSPISTVIPGSQSYARR